MFVLSRILAEFL